MMAKLGMENALKLKCISLYIYP